MVLFGFTVERSARGAERLQRYYEDGFHDGRMDMLFDRGFRVWTGEAMAQPKPVEVMRPEWDSPVLMLPGGHIDPLTNTVGLYWRPLGTI